MIKLVFTARPNWISRFIRWITKSPVSHVFIEYESKTFGGKWALEAWVPSVRSIPSHLAKENVYEEKTLLHKSFDVPTALMELGKYVGAPYDYKSVLMFIPMIIFKKIVAKWRHPLVTNKSQFCSELTARFLMLLKLPGTEEWEPECITPYDIKKYTDKHPEFFMPGQ